MTSPPRRGGEAPSSIVPLTRRGKATPNLPSPSGEGPGVRVGDGVVELQRSPLNHPGPAGHPSLKRRGMKQGRLILLRALNKNQPTPGVEKR